MFGLRAALSGARTLVASPKAAFTTSFAKARRSRKDVAIQIRLQFMGSTSDYTSGTEPQTVLQTLHASIKPVNAETDTTTPDGDLPSFLNLMFSKATSPSSSSFSRSNPSAYIQHHRKNLKIEPIVGTVREIHQEIVLRSTFMSEKLQLPIEKQARELVRRLTALENGNAKHITFGNVKEARGAVRPKKGSLEAQAVNITVKVHNMHTQLKNHEKDKHSFWRSLLLIYKRKNILLSLKEIDPERYRVCLDRLGLDPRVIEDELII